MRQDQSDDMADRISEIVGSIKKIQTLSADVDEKARQSILEIIKFEKGNQSKHEGLILELLKWIAIGFVICVVLGVIILAYNQKYDLMLDVIKTLGAILMAIFIHFISKGK